MSDPPLNPHLLDHHHIRLPAGVYRQADAVFSLTIAVLDRRQAFADTELAAAIVSETLDQCRQHRIRMYAFCLMPDHLHLILSPSPSCDVVSFIARLKSLTTRVAWRHGIRAPLWQRRFWDHRLRSDEQLGKAIEYVLNNPVRQGLVGEWQEYPFSGATA